MALLLIFAAFSVFGCEGGNGFMDDDSNCVRESNAEMNKSQAAAQNSSPLQAPLLLSAAPSAGPSITLSWKSGDTRSEGFTIERAESQSVTVWTAVALVAASITSYTDTDTVSDKLYLYRIKACCSGGESMPSAELSVKTTGSDRQLSN